ncbi:hypothetical protein BT93_A0816 [Corymbia citriodora subsp. variegata]|nr:hypothetical protein BT93_A0816 [Corymbia citriodora subsp. variegata]
MCCVLLLRSCDVWPYGRGCPSPSPSFTLFRVSCFVTDGNGGSLPWRQRRSPMASPDKTVAA